MRLVRVMVTFLDKEPPPELVGGREVLGIHFTYNGGYVRCDTGLPCCNEDSTGWTCTMEKGHEGLHRADDAQNIKPWEVE